MHTSLNLYNSPFLEIKRYKSYKRMNKPSYLSILRLLCVYMCRLLLMAMKKNIYHRIKILFKYTRASRTIIPLFYDTRLPKKNFCLENTWTHLVVRVNLVYITLRRRVTKCPFLKLIKGFITTINRVIRDLCKGNFVF